MFSRFGLMIVSSSLYSSAFPLQPKPKIFLYPPSLESYLSQFVTGDLHEFFGNFGKK
jgi:hypothetical protein